MAADGQAHALVERQDAEYLPCRPRHMQRPPAVPPNPQQPLGPRRTARSETSEGGETTATRDSGRTRKGPGVGMAGPLEIFNAAGNKLRLKIKICMQIYGVVIYLLQICMQICGFVVQTGQKICVDGAAVSARPCARAPPKARRGALACAARARARTV